MKIIVRAPNWIGDAILATPALGLLRKKYPQGQITVLAKEWTAPVFIGNPDADNVYIIKKSKSYFELIKDLKKENFDLGVLFPNSFSSALIFFLSRVSLRFGYATDGRILLLNRPAKRSSGFLREHQVDYYWKLVKSLRGEGSSPEESKNLIWKISEEEKAKAKEILQKEGVDSSDKLIGFNPGAFFGPAKRWSPEKFGELGNRLSKKFGAKIIIFASLHEKEAADFIESKMHSQPLNLAGRTSLREAAALIARCRIFVTNDSGMMHLAAAVGTPLAAIFGSTDPVRTGPWGVRSVILQKRIPCAPCFQEECKNNDYICLKRITVEDVLQAVEHLWKKE